MSTHRPLPIARRGFTIVEMLVAAALIMMIMYILSSCFAAALESFRKMKAIGDMQEKLRATTTILRNDLYADHFDRVASFQGFGPRVSDQKLADPLWQPPTDGFFRIWQGEATAGYGVVEGVDTDGNPSTRATTHILHFTVKRPGLRRDQMFQSAITDPPVVPPNTPNQLNQVFLRTMPQDLIGVGTFQSQWAEVAYFLIPTGTSAGTTPLYYLVRRERPLVPPGGYTNMPAAALNYGDMSQTSPNFMYPYNANNFTNPPQFNTPADVTAPCRRMNVYNYQNPGTLDHPLVTTTNWDLNVLAGNLAIPGGLANKVITTPGGYVPLQVANPTLAGQDILLTDVISFEIKVAYDNPPPGQPQPVATPGDEPPYRYLPQQNAATPTNTVFGNNLVAARVWDTWSKESLPTVGLPGSPAPLYDYSGTIPFFNGTTLTTMPSWSTPGTANSIPLRTRVWALQLRLRVWDAKSQQTRQVTLVQDL
jgi:hypothetical protein